MARVSCRLRDFGLLLYVYSKCVRLLEQPDETEWCLQPDCKPYSAIFVTDLE